MAMTGVLRPGHAQIRVLDMEESVKWYTEVMGLVPMGRDSQGRAYFKTRAERDHNSIILRQSDRAGMDFFGYKVLDKATLDEPGKKAPGLRREDRAHPRRRAAGDRRARALPDPHRPHDRAVRRQDRRGQRRRLQQTPTWT